MTTYQIQPIVIVWTVNPDLLDKTIRTKAIINGDYSPNHPQFDTPRDVLKSGWRLMGPPTLDNYSIRKTTAYSWWFEKT